MSSGSFVIESWSKGTEVSYVKNENYLHADEIYLDGINVRVIADESTRLELFEKGELDFLTLGTTGQAQYGDDPRVYFYEAFAVQEIEFNFENPDKPFLSNVNFRKALFYATDRETLAAISGNAPAVQAKYARLARAAGLGGSADTVALRNLKNGLIRLRKDLGLPQTLSQAGAPPAQVWAAAGEIVEAVLADPCCKTNPVPVEDYLVRRVLEEVTGNF